MLSAFRPFVQVTSLYWLLSICYMLAKRCFYRWCCCCCCYMHLNVYVLGECDRWGCEHFHNNLRHSSICWLWEQNAENQLKDNTIPWCGRTTNTNIVNTVFFSHTNPQSFYHRKAQWMWNVWIRGINATWSHIFGNQIPYYIPKAAQWLI